MTTKYHNVYLDKVATVVGPYEKIGPLSKRFDRSYDELYMREKSFESAEFHLMKESIDKIDYVIIHELSHLVYFDHSNKFWSVVGKYCPNYKQIRKEMRE